MCALHNAGGPGLSGPPDADFRAGVNFAFTLYPSFTEGLRLFNTEQWGECTLSVDLGALPSFSQLPESAA
jgi:hypothetical protein